MRISNGANVNQPGASETPRFVVNYPSPYQLAIVVDIILNESHEKYKKADGGNIGDAVVRIIPNDSDKSKQILRTASPIEANIQIYPLKNETVLLFELPGGPIDSGETSGRLFYTRPLNLTKKLTENSWSALEYQFGTPDVKNQEHRQLAKLGVFADNVSKRIEETVSLGEFFQVNDSIKMVRACEGDVNISGRFGSTIRMGSSLFRDPNTGTPEPNILITAGHDTTPQETSTSEQTSFSLTYESINRDKSSIWMVSEQIVDFTAATALSESPKKAHLFSSLNKTLVYDGAQIFINSDRIIINSKQNEISLFSNKEINLSSMKAMTMDTETDIFLNANRSIRITSDEDISLQGRNITLSATEDLSYETKGNYSIAGKKIFIGKYGDTSQPMVLGSTLSLWLNTLVNTLLTPGLIITTTGPANISPLILPVLQKLKGELGTHPSSAIFNSRDNYTSEANS